MAKPQAHSNQRQVWIDLSQWQALDVISDDTGAPVAELVRRAVAEYLKNKGGIK